jgi:hypothetical protein
MPIATIGTVDFLNLQDQTYLVKTFISPTASWHDGTQIGSDFYAYPGKTNTSVIKDDLWIIAGTTPGFPSEANGYDDPSLVDWVYSVELRGMGTLQPGVDIEILAGGGFRWINGYTIQTGEIYVIKYQPQVTSTQGGGSSNPKGKLFDTEITITTDTTLSQTAIGKIINLQGVNPYFAVTLPDINTVIDGQLTTFLSNGGSHIMVGIVGLTTKSFGRVANVYLAQSESVTIYKSGSAWKIWNADFNYKEIGDIFYSFTQLNDNCIPCDGRLLLRASYPRLWEWISILPNYMLWSDENWLTQNIDGSYPNVGGFSTGNGTTTFRVPLLMNTHDGSNNFVSSGFLRATGIPSCTEISGINGFGYPSLMVKDAVGNFHVDITGAVFKAPTNTSNQITVLDSSVNFGNKTLQNKLYQGKELVNGTYVLANETRPSYTALYLMMRY